MGDVLGIGRRRLSQTACVLKEIDAAATDEIAGTIARQGSFKAKELVMAAGADINQCADALRKNGIHLVRGCKLRACLGGQY
jgi:hypothetical protein